MKVGIQDREFHIEDIPRFPRKGHYLARHVLPPLQPCARSWKPCWVVGWVLVDELPCSPGADRWPRMFPLPNLGFHPLENGAPECCPKILTNICLPMPNIHHAISAGIFDV